MTHHEGTSFRQALIVAEFSRLAKILDAAGLGPADYLYAALKWRLQRPELDQFKLRRALRKACRSVLSNPPTVPRGLRRAPILAASSYLISANLLGEVAAGLDPGEAVLCDVREMTPRPLSHRLLDRLRALLALWPALIFTARVRATLIGAKAGSVECNRISLVAFSHRIHRQTARAILQKVRPRCLVIGNCNRLPEFALWAEARERGIFTVLLPYAEITLKPERFLSLCRGAFDLVLPFSETSVAQMRKLNPDVSAKVVGFPAGFNAAGSGQAKAEKPVSHGFEVLYLGGNNFEAAASELLHGAVDGCDGVRLRVRLHPRNQDPETRDLFNWLGSGGISDPTQTALTDDIASANAAIAVRSTAVIDVIIAGVPFIWLSPGVAQEQLKYSTIRKQNLASLEAATSAELRAILQRLMDDKDKRERVVNEQWSRLRAVGYDRDYFGAVRSALRQVVGSVTAETSL